MTVSNAVKRADDRQWTYIRNIGIMAEAMEATNAGFSVYIAVIFDEAEPGRLQ